MAVIETFGLVPIPSSLDALAEAIFADFDSDEDFADWADADEADHDY